MRLTILLPTTVALLGFCAAPAFGQDDAVAPPGNSGVDQYLEVVPGVGGDYRADDAEDRGGRAGAPDPTRLLGAATTAQLARMGPDGRRVAAVAALGAPRGRLVARGGAPRAERRSRMSIADRATGGAIGSATSALTGSGGGLGIGFPLLLAGGAAFAAARRFVRRS